MLFIPISRNRQWRPPAGETGGVISACACGGGHKLAAALEQRIRKADDSAAAQAVAARPGLEPGNLRECGPAIRESEHEVARRGLRMADAGGRPGAGGRRSGYGGGG